MAVIWGLDLHDMQWSKFKSSYMFGNTDYHMRRTKFIIYQCAMIFLVVSESLGTAVLSDYIDQQNALQRQFPGINVYNDDYVGIASYNIFVGVLAATIFGAVSKHNSQFSSLHPRQRELHKRALCTTRHQRPPAREHSKACRVSVFEDLCAPQGRAISGGSALMGKRIGLLVPQSDLTKV